MPSLSSLSRRTISSSILAPPIWCEYAARSTERTDRWPQRLSSNFASLTSSIASKGNLALLSSSAAIAAVFNAARRRPKKNKEQTGTTRYDHTFPNPFAGNPNNLRYKRGRQGLSIVAAVEESLITLKIVGGNRLGHRRPLMPGGLSAAAAIVGVAATDLSEDSGHSELRLAAEAVLDALDDAGLHGMPEASNSGATSPIAAHSGLVLIAARGNHPHRELHAGQAGISLRNWLTKPCDLFTTVFRWRGYFPR